MQTWRCPGRLFAWQSYGKLHVGNGPFNYHGYDQYVNLSVLNIELTVLPSWCLLGGLFGRPASKRRGGACSDALRV